MLRRLFLLIFTVFYTCNLHAQNGIRLKDTLFHKRPEIFVSIPGQLLSAKPEVISRLSIDGFSKDSVYLYLRPADSLFIRNHLPDLRLLPHPSTLHKANMAGDMDEVLAGEAYPSYEQYLQLMEYFMLNFPEICRIDTIGKSVNNRLILVAHLHKADHALREIPSFWYSSTIHGDEVPGYMMLILMINHLLNHSEDPEVSAILENTHVFICPLENPDGLYYASDTTINGAIRHNANGVDLNRNYPDPVSGEYSDGQVRQPEALAMMEYLKRIRPDISANFHAGTEVVNYPYDCCSELHADDAWFRLVSSEYADTAMAIMPGYMDHFPGGITNGFEWYQIYGGRQDYVCYYLRGREITIELSEVKMPGIKQIKTLWETNNPSLLNYIRQASYGIEGLVMDDISGEELKARIFILNHDRFHSDVYSDSLTGKFYRYLKAGKYSANISKDGYLSETINIELSDYQRIQLKIRLRPISEKEEQNSIHVFPNPFKERLWIEIYSEVNYSAGLEIYDPQGRLVEKYNQALYPGFNTFEVDVSAAEAGVYFLRVRLKERDHVLKILREKAQ